MTSAQYIQKKGFEFRRESGQIVLKTCPYCHDEKFHFYIDQQTESAPFFCHKCNQRGNLITLQKHLGDKPDNGTYNAYRKPKGGISAAFPAKVKTYKLPDENAAIKAHGALLQDTATLQYITKDRCISLDTVKAFKLGLEVDRGGGQWLTIPHYEGGKLVNIKSRSLPPAEKTFRRVKDCKSILFNQDAIDGEETIICEGELDALTLHDRSFKNVVATTTGAGGFDEAWIDQFEKVKKIFIVYDADEKGRTGARECARRLGYDRCFIIELPDGQDVNDYFKQGGCFADFFQLMQQARRFDVAGVMDIDRGLEQLRIEIDRPEQTSGIKTGWDSLDRLVKTGFCPGELVVLSAPPKIGKSSLALQVCAFNALENIPALFYSLEMRPMKVIEKIVKLHSETENIGAVQIDKTKTGFQGKPLYLGYAYQKPILEGIIETIKRAVRRYGLKLVVFDHLHFLCRSINNQVQEVGLAVQAFKFLAEEMEIPVILIAQPRKVNPDAIMTAQDLKDSSSIYSDCDHLILMHRQRMTGSADQLQDTAFSPSTLIRVEASRYNAGGETFLYFHGEYSRFDEMPKK